MPLLLEVISQKGQQGNDAEGIGLQFLPGQLSALLAGLLVAKGAMCDQYPIQAL